MTRRFSERSLEWTDVIGRFEARPSSEHLHNALAYVQRLKDDGRWLWDDGSSEWRRWKRGCSTLEQLIHTLGLRSQNSEDLATVLREVIQEFEHSTYRMRQVLHNADTSKNETLVDNRGMWAEVAFRFIVYAVVSRWLPDKTATSRVEMSINVTTGETTTRSTYEPQTVPRKYARAKKVP